MVEIGCGERIDVEQSETSSFWVVVAALAVIVDSGFDGDISGISAFIGAVGGYG